MSEIRAGVFGNLRKPVSPGLLGLSTIETALILLTVLCSVIVSLASTTAMVLMLLGAGAAALVLRVRDRNGRRLMTKISARLAFKAAQAQGHTVYMAGPTGVVPSGKCMLPGMAAESVLVDQNIFGLRFGLLSLPTTDHHTVIVRCQSSGHRLQDPAQVSAQVASWGAWLAGLGEDFGVVGAQVVVDTTPDTGLRMEQNVVSRIAPGAPTFATNAAAGVLEIAQHGTAQISTFVTITFKGSEILGGNKGTTDDVAREIASRLPMLVGGLAETGAGTEPHLMTAQQLTDYIRVAYDPSVALDVEQAVASGEGTGLGWADAGPGWALEELDTYWHEGALSRTWHMSHGPSGHFTSDALGHLLVSNHRVPRKRVTIVYRPQDVQKATNTVDRQVDSTRFNTSGRKVTARARQDQRVAERTADEQAQGAGLVLFGIIMTATVEGRDVALLEQAARTMERLPARLRTRMRTARGSQAANFQAALPLGLVLPEHQIFKGRLAEYMQG